jgi:hypothetical protein
MNDPMSANERAYLTEPERCEQHGTPTDSWGYCAVCDDEAYEYANPDCGERA